MKGNKLLIILASIIILLVVLVLIGKKKGIFGAEQGIDVAVTKAENRTIIETVTANGKIYPEVEVKISADVSGEIIELNVAEGDSVKEGQLLVRINPDIYESSVSRTEAMLNQMKANEAGALAQLTQVKAQYNQAVANYDRNVKLHNQQVISDSEFESITAAYQTAIANRESGEQSLMAAKYNVLSSIATLKEARDNLKKTIIYAPVSGIISKLNVEKGERVLGTVQMQGTEVLRIANLNNMEARVDVTENDILRVSLGDEVEIEVDAYIDQKFKGVVTQIAHSPNQDVMTSSDQVTNFQVDIRLIRASYKELIQPEKGHRYPFRPGMSTSVEIQTEKVEDVLAVPIRAVTSRNVDDEASENGSAKDRKGASGEASVEGNSETLKDDETLREVVFALGADGNVKQVEVKTGIQDDNYIQILSGIEKGREVVTAPYKAISKTLKDDDKVNVMAEKELFNNSKKNKGD